MWKIMKCVFIEEIFQISSDNGEWNGIGKKQRYVLGNTSACVC